MDPSETKEMPVPEAPKDSYICITCTADVHVYIAIGVLETPRIMIHENSLYFDNPDPAHFPPWGTEMTIPQQREMYDYECRIRDELAQAIGELLERLEFEKGQGVRDPNVDVLSINRMKVNIDTIAKRSDTTDRPLFPEDVIEWRDKHRELFGFPTHLATIPHPQWDGDTHETLLTQGEVYALCIHLNSVEVGTGSQLMGGRLADQFTEKEMDEQWRKPLPGGFH